MRPDGQKVRPPGSQWPRLFLACLLAGRLTAWPSDRLTAQEPSPAVLEAIRLASEGRSDSARRLIESQLTLARAGQPAYVEALYWRARLAAYGDSAERDFRRVALEFPNSPWADDALLELAQLALTSGNPASALGLAARLRSDYPGSPLRPRAALWGARASFQTGEAAAACALLDSARTEGAADLEFVNQVAFYQARCSPALAGPPRLESTATRKAPAPAESAPSGPAAGAGGAIRTTAPLAPARSYEVQAAATRSDTVARQLVRRLERAGHRARLEVGTDGMRRVRVGPYRTQSDAVAAARAIRSVVGGTPFVVALP